MQDDQAAGLRSKSLPHHLRVISLIDAPADFALRLAQALMARDQKVLLVDSVDRHTRTHNTPFIFGWQQQLAQQGLHTLRVSGVEVMHAPGAQAGDTTIVRASANYHAVIFDACELQTTITLESRTPQLLLVALSAHHDTLAHAYALIKTLHQRKLNWRVFLMGDVALAERVIAAVACFLPAQSGLLEYMNLNADAHLRALAAKISAADFGIGPFDNNTGKEYAQHG